MQHPEKVPNNPEDMDESQKDLLLDAYKQALVMICDIGWDYDGERSVEGLKGLVDELVRFASDGLNEKRPQYIRGNGVAEEMVMGKWTKVQKD